MRERTRLGYEMRSWPKSAGKRLAIMGAVALGIAPILMPPGAQAAVNSETSTTQNNQSEMDDEAMLEPMQSDALVIEEDESPIGMLKLDLNQQGSCRAQFRVTAQQWWDTKNTKNFRPWVNKVFKVSGFVNFTKTVLGISTNNGEGEVLFNNESAQKPPVRVVELVGRGDQQGRMPVRVERVEGFTKTALVPCGRLQRFPFLLQIKGNE